jgi:hypothetical protein
MEERMQKSTSGCRRIVVVEESHRRMKETKGAEKTGRGFEATDSGGGLGYEWGWTCKGRLHATAAAAAVE